ncbi:ribonuclease E/G, partial [Micromonospora zamorensis]
PAAEQATTSSRRRARKNAPTERAVVEVVDTDTSAEPDADYQDTMGYDLSRYESDTAAAPAISDSQQGESARLAAADDPDALADGDGDEDATEGGAGRRRSRRGGARRRTRP